MGVWHIGNFQNGLVFMLFFVLSTIGYSAVMGWLVLGTCYNLVFPTLFHFSVDVGFFILQDAVTDIRFAALNGLVWMGAAVLVVICNKKASLQFQGHEGKNQQNVVNSSRQMTSLSSADV